MAIISQALTEKQRERIRAKIDRARAMADTRERVVPEFATPPDGIQCPHCGNTGWTYEVTDDGYESVRACPYCYERRQVVRRLQHSGISPRDYARGKRRTAPKCWPWRKSTWQSIHSAARDLAYLAAAAWGRPISASQSARSLPGGTASHTTISPTAALCQGWSKRLKASKMTMKQKCKNGYGTQICTSMTCSSFPESKPAIVSSSIKTNCASSLTLSMPAISATRRRCSAANTRSKT